MAKAWNADIPVTDVDPAARTFTAEVTDPMLILMQSPWLADRITVVVHIPDVDGDGNPVPMPAAEGDVLLLRAKIAGS